MISEILRENGSIIVDSFVGIITTIITGVASYVAIEIKKGLQKTEDARLAKEQDKVKKDTAQKCVEAVEQMYKDLDGDAKLEKCIEAVSEILEKKGIEITEMEIRILIEAAVRTLSHKKEELFMSDDILDGIEVSGDDQK